VRKRRTAGSAQSRPTAHKTTTKASKRRGSTFHPFKVFYRSSSQTVGHDYNANGLTIKANCTGNVLALIATDGRSRIRRYSYLIDLEDTTGGDFGNDAESPGVRRRGTRLRLILGHDSQHADHGAPHVRVTTPRRHGSRSGHAVDGQRCPWRRRQQCRRHGHGMITGEPSDDDARRSGLRPDRRPVLSAMGAAVVVEPGEHSR